MTQAAVLTGDLIASTDAGPEAIDVAMDRLHVALTNAETALHLSPTRFTRYRGDGWQAMIVPHSRYLRAVAHILSNVRAMETPLETRIGVGIGFVERVKYQDLSDASGPAFTLSGHALDRMPTTDRLALSGLPDTVIQWHRAALDTLAYLSSRWSREQAEALHFRLDTEARPLHRMATDISISRQALSSRLAVAGEKPLMALIRAAEATL
jgi:hypothetical protein